MIRLTVLGSCGTYPGPGRACSGYLFEAPASDGGTRPTRVWVDTGSGTLSNLLRHATLDEVDAVWVSHLHVDHYTDLPVAYFTLKFGQPRRARPLPVFGPTGWAEHLERFLTVDTSRSVRDMFEVHELFDGDDVQIGRLNLRAVATLHSVETYGVRATSATATVSYSADSGPCDALGHLADRSDLFLCEAAWPDRPPEAEMIHCTPAEAGHWAARGGARRLVLTHIRPSDDTDAALAEAGKAYGADVGAAREGDVYEVGAPKS
jgi:ribonuclease BN (tRNA processing enzyme)